MFIVTYSDRVVFGLLVVRRLNQQLVARHFVQRCQSFASSLGSVMLHTRSIGHPRRRHIFWTVCALWIALSGQAEAQSISLAWDAPPETVATYYVGTGTQPGGPYTYEDVGNVTSYTVMALTMGQVYYFVVRAENSAGQSLDSAEISGGPFTDDPLVAGVSSIKTIHFQELRDHIDALRASRALPTIGWVDPVLSPGAVEVRDMHLSQMRTALDAVYVFDTLPLPPYTNTISQGGAIRAVDLSELRTALVTVE